MSIGMNGGTDAVRVLPVNFVQRGGGFIAIAEGAELQEGRVRGDALFRRRNVVQDG